MVPEFQLKVWTPIYFLNVSIHLESSFRNVLGPLAELGSNLVSSFALSCSPAQ